MFCPKCGKRVSDKSDFCIFCGGKIIAHQVIKNDSLIFNHEPESNIITLTCPSCGGRLSVNKTKPTLNCFYCGAEHLVRNDANEFFLEAFARCPICNRNDKSTKAKIFFGALKEPNFLGILEPQPADKYIAPTIIIAIGLLLFVALMIGDDDGCSTALGIIFIPLFLFGFFSSLNKAISFSKHNRDIIIQNSRSKEINRKRKKKFIENIKKWDDIYYCKRDGTYFSIREDKIIPKNEIDNILGI